MKKYLITIVDISTGKVKTHKCTEEHIKVYVDKYLRGWTNVNNSGHWIADDKGKSYQQAGTLKDTGDRISILSWY